MHPLYDAIPVPYVPMRVTSVLWSHIGILMCLLAVEPRSTGGLLFCSQCLCGILLHSVFYTVELEGFKSTADAFLLA